jgi:hypothetical protein
MLKSLLHTALVLFVLASSVIIPADMIRAHESMTIDNTQDQQTDKERDKQGLIRDGLYWWLDHPSGDWGWQEWAQPFIDVYNFLGRYVHNGPSR